MTDLDLQTALAAVAGLCVLVLLLVCFDCLLDEDDPPPP